MRHGRKTKSKRFNGYKRHLAIDLDTLLVLAVAVLPANRPEEDAAPGVVVDILQYFAALDQHWKSYAGFLSMYKRPLCAKLAA